VAALADAIRRCDDPPKAFVQAASLAIYGDTREVCDESAPFGTGFSVDVCRQWEEAWSKMALPKTRASLLRIGFALGANGGALPTLANLARRGLGGTVGSGAQYISWLHVADLNQMFRWAIEREDMTGIFNATGPTPVTNREFMRVLRAVLNRPWSPPAPAWLVRIGAALMGTEASLALTGRRCVPKRFIEMGFAFRYTDLEATLQELLVSQR
jgi:uncharacterized protein (TIGR01777 family)